MTTILSLTIASILLSSCKPEGQAVSEGVSVDNSYVMIGSDDRIATKNGNLESSLSRKVGQIRATLELPNGEYADTTCSATMIAKNHIITAAHCFIVRELNNALLTDAYFYPGALDENNVPNGRFPLIKSFNPLNYQQVPTLDNLGFDIGVAKLGQNSEGKDAGDIVGWMSMWGQKEIAEELSSTIGYPGDKDALTQYYENNCSVAPYIGSSLEVDCDVYRGQSGSALIRYSKEHKLNYIFGVINAESAYQNYGARITSDRQKIISAIIKENYDSAKFEEKWIENNHTHSEIINLFVKNDCAKDLYSAVNFKDIDNTWKTIGFYLVKSNQTMHVGQTTNGVFYFAGSYTQGRSYVNRRDIVKDLPDDRGNNIELEKSNVSKYGDFVKTFDCN